MPLRIFWPGRNAGSLSEPPVHHIFTMVFCFLTRKQLVKLFHRAAVVFAFFDALLQKGFEAGMHCDGVIEQGVGADLIGANCDQIA